MLRAPILIALIALLAFPPALSGQATWQPSPGTQPAGRGDAAVAYDSGRQRVVLFGGLATLPSGGTNDTWEWDGSAWEHRISNNTPPGRYAASIAYDPLRNRCILFGGIGNGSLLGDTWAWTGRRWNQLPRAIAPSPRASASLVFDSRRGILVLFGGNARPGNTQPLDDLWEWDGQNWSRRDYTGGPGPVAFPLATYDDDRGRMVVYLSSSHELWEWDGERWFLADGDPPFPTRFGATFSYDRKRKRSVFYGGAEGITPQFRDTWEWDGTRWEQIPTTVDAGPRGSARSIYDSEREQVLLVAGYGSQLFYEYLASITAFDGANWSQLTPDRDPINFEAGIGWDGNTGRPITFGGQSGFFSTSQETHTFDGERWVHMPDPTPPAPRSRHGLQWHRDRGEVVMFGGWIGAVPTDETWVWDGEGWSQRLPQHSPPPRSYPAMAYDERRQQVVLFGGAGAGFDPPFADTWVWDGKDWLEVVSAESPPPLQNATLSYDSTRECCVLFGGSTRGGAIGETWEFDGVEWKKREPVTSPSPRSRHTAVFDPVRDRVVLFGGNTVTGAGLDTWEWDGQDWTEIELDRHPYAVRAIFDEERARTMAFADAFEVWEYRSENPPDRSNYGPNCGQATLTTSAPDYPVLGRELTLRVGPSRRFWPVLFQLGLTEIQPIPLRFFGFRGCLLLQSGEISVLRFADWNGEAEFTLPALTDPDLLGLTLHAQAFVREPRRAGNRWVTTQGLRLRYGR